jgi:Zn-dependent protease
MNSLEPSQTKFDLRGRFFGVPLRVHPFFWSSAAALGIRYYADPEGGSLGYFAFWIAAVLACVLLHAFGQACMGRLFGMRGGIVLYGLGSHISGVKGLSRCRQRVIVLSAGPIVQAALIGCILGLTEIPFPAILSDWGWQTPVATGAVMLVQLNIAWGLLNILPLWPFAGGRIALELGETILGKKGRAIALVLSLATAAIMSVWVALEMSRHLSNRYDPNYLIHLEEGSIRLLFCFILWTKSFKALWTGTESRPQLLKQR